MNDSHPLAGLADRGKEPRSKRHLDQWVIQAASRTGMADRRLSWLVASSIVIAALQRECHEDGHPLILLKGGTYLEMRLGLDARATQDVDTVLRGAFEDFEEIIDRGMAPWGPLELSRDEIKEITGAQRVVKPRRFNVRLSINGEVWRKIPVEVSPDEGALGQRVEVVEALPLGHFGLPSPIELAGIALDYQVAQKLHGCSDPHQPPDETNTRARDVVDLVLLRRAFYQDGPDLQSLRGACHDLFEARARERETLGREPRAWPPEVVAHDGWAREFQRACSEAEIEFDLDEAIAEVNDWIRAIESG